MSVNDLQALAQQLADASNQHDLQTVKEMLSEDLEVFDGSTSVRRLRGKSRRNRNRGHVCRRVSRGWREK